jgi:hypothetical protein
VSQELPQRFAVRLITVGATPRVQQITLDAQNRAKIDLSGLGTDYRKAVIVVLGETDGTTERASYRYQVTQEERPDGQASLPKRSAVPVLGAEWVKGLAARVCANMPVGK